MILTVLTLSWALVTKDIQGNPLKVDGYNVYKRRGSSTYSQPIAFRTGNKYNTNTTYHGFCFAVRAIYKGIEGQRSKEKCL